MRVACVQASVRVPGIYSRWLVFDSFEISIISFHEIKQQTTKLSLKLSPIQSDVNVPGMKDMEFETA